MENTEKDLPDFLAERAISEGACIAFVECEGVLWVEIDREEVKETEILLQLTAEELISSIPVVKELMMLGKISIPVLRKQEEEELKNVLQQLGLTKVNIYRLSSVERFAYHSRKFQDTNSAV